MWHSDATDYARRNPGRFGCEDTDTGLVRYWHVYGDPALDLRVEVVGLLYRDPLTGERGHRFEVGGIRFNREGARNAFDYARALASGQTPEAIRAMWGLPKARKA